MSTLGGKKESSGFPAWMLAQALVIKAKNVLFDEAINLLYKEIDEKRMALTGKFLPIDPEKSGEMEQGLFLVQQLLEKKDAIIKDFDSSIRKLENEAKDENDVKRLDDTKRFLIAIEKIALFASYAGVFGEWFDSVSAMANANSASAILVETSRGIPHRIEALRFLIDSKLVYDKELFDDDERDIVIKAISSIDDRK